jgi:hypothetical protein
MSNVLTETVLMAHSELDLLSNHDRILLVLRSKDPLLHHYAVELHLCPFAMDADASGNADFTVKLTHQKMIR